MFRAMVEELSCRNNLATCDDEDIGVELVCDVCSTALLPDKSPDKIVTCTCGEALYNYGVFRSYLFIHIDLVSP